MTRCACPGLDGPLELAAQAQRGDRAQEQVVDEGKPAQHLVAVGRVGDDRDEDGLGRRRPRAARPRPPPARPRGSGGRRAPGRPASPSSAAWSAGERAHLLGRGGWPAGRRRGSRACRPRSGGRPWLSGGGSEGSVAQRTRRRDAARLESRGSSISRSGAAARSAGRVEAPGHARPPASRRRGPRPRRSPSRRPSRSRRAEAPSSDMRREEPGRVGLARGHVARAPDPGEAGGRPRDPRGWCGSCRRACW